MIILLGEDIDSQPYVCSMVFVMCHCLHCVVGRRF